MALTKAQRRTVGEIEDVLRLGSYDWRVVETLYEPDARLQQLKRIKLDFIRAKVIGDYVFVDELLTVIIVNGTAGLEAFDADMRRLTDYLFQLAFGKRLADFASKLKAG